MRIKCGTALPICQTLGREEILNKIDWQFYDSAKEKMQTQKIQKLSDERLDIICNIAIEEYITNRLQNSKVLIFKEKSLRNYAQHRINNKKGFLFTWKDILNEEENKELFKERNDNKMVPLCRGILIALYEHLASKGHKEIIQFYDEIDEIPVTNAVELYKLISEKSPVLFPKILFKIDFIKKSE
ncbi:MAG: hypothetical protein WCI04_04030 [archaeon]